MRIVMTLLVRDEADVVDEQLRFHLDRGVDFVIATDHLSVDGTSEILRRYEREGYAHVIREERKEHAQPVYVTHMARLAATQFGADWVINADADEFWWPREGSFQEILAAVPNRFGVVIGSWRHFVLRPDSEEPFYERMRWRRPPSREVLNPYGPGIKVLHRADPHVRVGGGNHKAFGRGLVLLRDWVPVEILHFPIRSRAHLEQKFSRTTIGRGRPGPPHWLQVGAELVEGGPDPIYSRFIVEDDELAAGLVDGSFTEDLRVRNVLRGEHVAAEPSLGEDVAIARELSEHREAASYEALSWRLDGLGRRLYAVEGVVELASRNA